MGMKMYKYSEEEQYKQTSVEGKVGQAFPTVTVVYISSFTRLLNQQLF